MIDNNATILPAPAGPAADNIWGMWAVLIVVLGSLILGVLAGVGVFLLLRWKKNMKA
jgi:hypothetical protein